MIREITESFYPDKMEFGSEKTDKIFGNANKRHEDLKEMLDNNKDSLKLEAMKRIIGMVAKGKNAAHLFPAVVKNVASKNIEVKKLVYVYLVRYAEEQQDLALLSISTFQKGLKDPNQLIRASALRVLSSIRVPMIAPIMLLAIKEGMMDMSPYVRKTTALALPKLYKLDPEMRDTLIEVIEKLLTDKSTLVIGSAIVAFDNICPERDDILKRVFAKITRVFFTNASANTSSMICASQSADEWSICNVIYTLTRFACRRLILRPDQVKPVIFAKIGEKINKTQMDADNKSPIIHPDLKQLLKHTKPLLQSRNSAVVVSVVQLYYHCAQPEEMTCLIKPLIRLLRAYREVECIVLKIIHTFCLNPRYRELFEPHIKSFYINHSDATIIKVQKLEIITLLANETNIPLVLREFQSYVTDPDKIFASTTIKCIGKCAQSIPSIQATCINGLLALMHSPNESVVSESVIVIKNLLRTSDEPSELTQDVQYDGSKKSKSTSKQTILDGMSKLLIKDYLIPLCKSTLQTESADNTLKNSHQGGENDKTTNVYSNKSTTNESNNCHNTDCKLNPEAVSCIMWLLVSHGDVKTYEMQLPDILRLCAKCFIAQDILVKYQTLTLATQLYLYWKDKIKHTNATQFTTIELITKYIFDLAKYDLSYDLRDKARSLRYICFTDHNGDGNDTNWLHIFSLFNNSKGSLPFENKKVVSHFNKENGSDHLNVENSGKRIGQDTDYNNYISPYQLGSLSHYLQTRVEGYRDLCAAIDYQNLSSSNQQNNLLETDSKFCTENIEQNENAGKTLNNDNIQLFCSSDGENKDDILSSYTVEDWWALSPPSPAPTPTSYAIQNGGPYNETSSRYERGEEANPEYFHENDEDTNKSGTVLTKSNQSKGKSKRNNSGKDVNILSTKEEYEKFFESLTSDESQSENDSNEGGKIIGKPKPNNIQKTVEEFFSSDDESEEGGSIKHGNSTSSESMFDEMASFTKKHGEKLENKQANKVDDYSTTKPTMSNIDDLLLDLDISNGFGTGNIISDYTTNLENSLSNQSSNAFNISSKSLLTPLKTENIDKQRDSKTSQNSYQKCLRPLYINTDYTPLDTIQFFKSLNNSSTGGGQELSFSTKTSPLSIAFKFSRKVHMANAHMLNVELKFTNNLKQGDDGSNSIIEGLVFDKAETISMSCYPFYQITSILPGQCVHTNMGIDFKESACPFVFSLKFRTKKSDVVEDTIYENVKAECRIQAPIGEQILPIIMNQSDFDAESKKLTGMMHQSTEILPIPLSVSNDLFTDIGQLRDISHSYLLRPPKHGIEFDAKTVFANTPSVKQLYWTILKHFNAYFCPESLLVQIDPSSYYDTNAAVVETTSKENISNNTFNMSFSAKTIKSESLVLFNLSVTQLTCTLKTYCSQVMLSDIILKELSTAIVQCLDEKNVL